MILHEHKSKWKRIHEIAIKIEQGLPPINEILSEIAQCRKYGISESLVPELRTMSRTGTSPMIEEYKRKVLELSRRELENLS